MEKKVGRPRIKVDMEILRQVRGEYPDLSLRDLRGKYYDKSGIDLSHMTLWRRCKESGLN